MKHYPAISVENLTPMFNGEFHIWRVYQEKNQLKVSPPKLFEEEPDVAHLSFIRMHIYMAYFE